MQSTWKSPLLKAFSQTESLGIYDNCECVKTVTNEEQEYRAIRNSVAISDNCHYGKYKIAGSDALDVVNKCVLADVARLAIGRATWTFMLNENGSILCDVYVVCVGDEYLLFSEGASPELVLAALQVACADSSVKLTDMTTTLALISVDGPYAWELMKELVGVKMLGLRYLEFVEQQNLGGCDVTIMRAGKTGEFGYQIAVPVEHAEAVWNQLLQAGAEFDVAPVGFEVLSLCRLENRFINMHCEGTATKNPLELNCRVMIDREKEEYTGHDALSEALAGEVESRIIGISVVGNEQHVPLIDAPIVADGQVLGRIVNARYSPTLGTPIALALVDADVAFVGLDFEVSHEGGSLPARTVSAPFIFNRSMTIRPQEDSYRNR